jgi:hypothetical protein
MHADNTDLIAISNDTHRVPAQNSQRLQRCIRRDRVNSATLIHGVGLHDFANHQAPPVVTVS